MPESGTQGKEGKMEKEKMFQVKLEISLEEWQELSRMAGAYEQEPGELLGRFIADLTYANGSGGSDEREMANNWYQRSYGMLEGDTFVSWLCRNKDLLDEVANLKKEIEKLEGDIAAEKARLEEDRQDYEEGRYYYINIYKDGAYQGKRKCEWNEVYKDYEESVSTLQEEAEYARMELKDIWETFKKEKPSHREYEEEMEKVDAWLRNYNITEEKEDREHSANKDAKPVPKEKGPKL